MEFDPEKWDQIVKQWDAEDTSSAADDLESGKDAMDLADPKTWAEHDAMAKGAGQLVGEAQATDQDARKNGIGQLAAQALQAPTRIRAPIQPDSQPATAGAGEKGNAGLPVSAAEPAASPPPPPESLDWKGLGQRLKNAELSRGLSQGAESMFANIGAQSGYKPNQHAGDAGVDMVRGELDLAKAKQGQESHDASMAANKAALGVKHAMDDPNSLQSQKARESIKSFFGDIQLPRGFDAWSANDVGKFANSGTLAHVASIKNATADDARKVADKQAKDTQTASDLESSRKNYAKELKSLGVDPVTASQKDIDRAIQIGHNNATENMAASNNRIAVAAEGRKANEQEQLGQGIPFGGTELKYTGHGTPRADDVNEAQKVAALYGAAIDGMDDLKGKIDDFAKRPSAATKDAVASAARIVGGHLNTAFGQGAMSKDEAEAMSQVLGSDMRSTAGVQAFIDKMTGDDPAVAQALTRKLKAARESTSASALGKLKTYRFSPAGGAHGGSKVKVSNGKESLMIDAADLDAASADGYRRVQ